VAKTIILTSAFFVIGVFCVAYPAPETAHVRCGARADSKAVWLFPTSELNFERATPLRCGEEVLVVGRAYWHGKDSVRVRRQDGREGYVLPEQIQIDSESPASQGVKPGDGTAHPVGSRLAKVGRGSQLIGMIVSREQVEMPNRLAGALRGALLGAALTPPPPSEPSGTGDGVSRAAQGTIAALQAAEQMRYPKRALTVYLLHSGYYVLTASVPSSKAPDVRTADAVRFRVKNHHLFIADDVGRTFKLRLVQVERVSAPYLPAPGTGPVFSQPSGDEHWVGNTATAGQTRVTVSCPPWPGQMIYIVGCIHDIQSDEQVPLLWGSQAVKEQRAYFCQLIEQILSAEGTWFIGEEWGRPHESFAAALAKKRGAPPPQNINTTVADLDRMGIPGDHMDGYFEGRYTSQQIAEWHEKREDFMFSKVKALRGNATSVLVICGFDHLYSLAEIFRRSGEEVTPEDYRTRSWYRKDVFFPSCLA